MIVTPGWKDAYDYSEAIVYLLDADLRITRCNSAWDRFAIANSGEDVISSEVVGRGVMDVIPGVLREFYSIAYESVRKARRDWWHVFECSSPSVSRHFHMRILPAGQRGFVTVNTLIAEEPAGVSEATSHHQYADEDGIVSVCSHCRRAQRLNRPDVWDWVPDLLMRGKVLARPALCDFCETYHRRGR